MFFVWNDRRIHFVDGGFGPALLSLHGRGGNADNWLNQRRFSSARVAQDADYCLIPSSTRYVEPGETGFGEVRQQIPRYTTSAPRAWIGLLDFQRQRVNGSELGN
jgi:hypothetical protein